MVRDLLYGREILFSCVEMVNRYLVHSYIHYGAVRPMAVVAREVRLTD